MPASYQVGGTHPTGMPYLLQHESKLVLAIIVKYGFPTKEMSSVVSSIFEVSMKKIALWIGVRVDNWTAELVIIASNARDISSLPKISRSSTFHNKFYPANKD